MTKTIPSGIQTHIASEVTNLCTIWRITRIDNTKFRFTDHDVDVISRGFVYKAKVGYSRSAIANLSGFTVDNVDIEGILSSDEISEDDLRAGRYDFADVEVAIVNWKDTSLGEIIVRKGTFGEIIYSEETGSFKTELRGMMARMNQIILPVYQMECRVDLGSIECGIPIWPDRDQRSTAYSISNALNRPDVVKAADIAPTSDLDFILPFDDDFIDHGINGYVPTLNGGSLTFTGGKFGSALLFDPVDRFAIDKRLDYTPEIGKFAVNEKFTIECYFRDTIAPSQNQSGVLVACMRRPADVDWVLFRDAGGGVVFRAYDASNVLQIEMFGSHPGGADNGLDWNHVAVTRDDVDNYNLWLNGALAASTTDATVISHEPVLFARFMIGTGGNFDANYVLGVAGGVGSDEPVEMDEIRVLHGFEKYTAPFTPPTVSHPVFFEDDIVSDDLGGDIYYECTVSGTTASTRPTFDPVVGNTTVDGTVTWTARDAWTRHGEVTGASSRRLFQGTVTEPRFIDGWFDFGVVIFETGPNIGLGMEVKISLEATTGEVSIELFLSMPFPIGVGDEFRIYAGCDKRLATCRDKFDNVLNFRAEPYVVGNDQVFRTPNARG